MIGRVGVIGVWVWSTTPLAGTAFPLPDHVQRVRGAAAGLGDHLNWHRSRSHNMFIHARMPASLSLFPLHFGVPALKIEIISIYEQVFLSNVLVCVCVCVCVW